MCENSRQRVNHISTSVAVIFLDSRVARVVNGGLPEAGGGVAVWVSGPGFRLTPPEVPPPSPASSEGSTGMVPVAVAIVDL